MDRLISAMRAFYAADEHLRKTQDQFFRAKKGPSLQLVEQATRRHQLACSTLAEALKVEGPQLQAAIREYRARQKTNAVVIDTTAGDRL